MEFNIATLVFVLGLILGSQVVALFVQYRVNRTYKGIGYWLLGSSSMSLGFISMSFIKIKSLENMAIIANPLIILGLILLYVGITKFLDEKLNKGIALSIFTVFNLIYYYYMYIDNNLFARTLVISVTIAIISFMMAYQLFFKKDSILSGLTRFTAAVFFAYGLFYTLRVFLTIMFPPGQAYGGEGSTIVALVIVSIIASNLWTLGLIIMVGQRLNIENQLEKEKLQLIFNTNIDAQLITRLEDGLIADVNDEFVRLSGYSESEIIQGSMNGEEFWYRDEERQVFIRALEEKGYCENMELVFLRKDGSQLACMVSARIIIIHSVVHIISVIRDVTKRKQIELEMQELVQQLEIERNTAQLNAITDSLTGLFNRGHFDKTLRTEFARLTRSETKLSLIMLDIDHFKKFNDSYGHLAGDKCLQMIATKLKSSVDRAADIVARYGGEEFIVILPDTDEKGAIILGERMLKSIENLAIPHIESETSKYVTVSAGIITIDSRDSISPDQALKLVDEALYSAKEQGRNRCVYSS